MMELDIFWSRLVIASGGWILGAICSGMLLIFTSAGRRPKPSHLKLGFHLEDWIPSIILFLAAFSQFREAPILGNWSNVLNILLALSYIVFVFAALFSGMKATVTMRTSYHPGQNTTPGSFFHVPQKFRPDWDRLWIMTCLPSILFLHIFLLSESSPLDGGVWNVFVALFIFSGGGTWAVVASIGLRVKDPTERKQAGRVVIKAFIFSALTFVVVFLLSWFIYNYFGLLQDDQGILGDYLAGFCLALIPPLFFFQHRVRKLEERRPLLAVIVLVVIGIVAILATAIYPSAIVGILYLITILGLILFIEWRYPVAGFRSDVLIRVRPGDEAKVISGLDKMAKNGVYDARLVFGMHDIVATVSAINDEAAIEIIMKIREIPGVLSTTTLIGLKS